MLDQKRIRLLRVAQRETRMSDNDFRALIGYFGKDCPGMNRDAPSSKCLTLPAFNEIMNQFERMGFISTAKRALNNSVRRPGAATLKQIAMVECLWRDYTTGVGDQRTLGLWLEGTFKISSARFLTFTTARKAISALNIMIKRSKGACSTSSGASGAEFGSARPARSKRSLGDPPS